MEKGFWERKGVKTAFVWIVFDAIMLSFFLYSGFSRGFAEANWILLFVALVNIDRIVIPLADLPEPPGIFTFLIGLIPVGALIAYYVSLRTGAFGNLMKIEVVLAIVLLLWNAANIGWGIWEKKKLS